MRKLQLISVLITVISALGIPVVHAELIWGEIQSVRRR